MNYVKIRLVAQKGRSQIYSKWTGKELLICTSIKTFYGCLLRVGYSAWYIRMFLLVCPTFNLKEVPVVRSKGKHIGKINIEILTDINYVEK